MVRKANIGSQIPNFLTLLSIGLKGSSWGHYLWGENFGGNLSKGIGSNLRKVN